MTLFDFMPTLWIILAFLFFAVYFLSGMRLFLTGCGAALLALCPALTGAGIFIQAVLFFAYIGGVYCACLLKSKCIRSRVRREAIALTAIDRRGGYILYKGRVCRAYPKSRFHKYRLGDVLYVKELSNGSLRACRI